MPPLSGPWIMKPSCVADRRIGPPMFDSEEENRSRILSTRLCQLLARPLPSYPADIGSSLLNWRLGTGDARRPPTKRASGKDDIEKKDTPFSRSTHAGGASRGESPKRVPVICLPVVSPHAHGSLYRCQMGRLLSVKRSSGEDKGQPKPKGGTERGSSDQLNAKG